MDRFKLKKKYYGEVADNCDATREHTSLWLHQQQAVEQYLDAFPAGTRVLDVPVGTGRFLPSYEKRGFDVLGVDVSTAMLERARQRTCRADLRLGDIFQLQFPNNSFDVVVCVRILNWLGSRDFQRAFAEVVRVARGALIANVKTFTPWKN